MQVQKRVVGLFAVIASPILLFAANHELIYAIWPRHSTVSTNTADVSAHAGAGAANTISTPISTNATPEAADADISSNGSISCISCIGSSGCNGSDVGRSGKDVATLTVQQRAAITARAQQLVASWNRSIGDPLLLNATSDMGGILLANQVYVIIGPMMPLKVQLKEHHKVRTAYADNQVGLAATNMWLELMKERTQTLEHFFADPVARAAANPVFAPDAALEVPQNAEVSFPEGGVQHLAAEQRAQAQAQWQGQGQGQAPCAPLAQSVLHSAECAESAERAERAEVQQWQEEELAKLHTARAAGAQNLEQEEPKGAARVAPSTASVLQERAVLAVPSASHPLSSGAKQCAGMTLEQLAHEDSAEYGDEYATPAETGNKAGTLGATGATNSTGITSHEGMSAHSQAVAMATADGAFTIPPAEQESFKAIAQALADEHSFDISQILAAEKEPYNPLDGSHGNYDFEWDDLLLQHLKLTQVPTVHTHNQLRSEVIMQEGVREGNRDKVKWSYRIPPKGKAGILGFTPLRSWKNHAHIANILASRAAIDAGLSPEEAYILSDKLFLVVEEITDPLIAKRMRYVVACAFALQVKAHHERLKEASQQVVESALVRKVRFYVQQHLFDKISLRTIAEALDYTPEYLTFAFKRVHGVSLMRYVQQERLERAKDLLLDTHITINDIASLLQFSSAAHFCKAFKLAEHLTPSQWRTQHATVVES